MAAPLANEPVAFAELMRAVLVVLVALGWLTIDEDSVNVIVSFVGLALSWLARNRVTPVAVVVPPPAGPPAIEQL